jgi:hypothetical protein
VRVDTGARVGAWLSRAADTPGQASMVKGLLACRPGQGTCQAAAQRGLRSVRATPPVITPRPTRTRLASGLSSTPVFVRASLGCTRATSHPYGAPVSARRHTAWRDGMLATTSWLSVSFGDDEAGCRVLRYHERL